MDNLLFDFIKSNIQDCSDENIIFVARRLGVASYLPEHAFRNCKKQLVIEKIAQSEQKKINTHILRDMGVIQKVLAEHGITAVFIKGPLLGMQIYNKPETRKTNDIDLLVKFSDTAKTYSVLTELGYTSNSGLLCKPEDFWFAQRGGSPEIRFNSRHASFNPPRDKSFSCGVELHINPWRSYDTQSNAEFIAAMYFVFENLGIQTVDSIGYNVLSIPDCFLQMCCHYTRHLLKFSMSYCEDHEQEASFPLNHVHDLAVFYSKYHNILSASELMSGAVRYGCEIDLKCSAKPLKDIYGIKLYDHLPPVCVSDPESRILGLLTDYNTSDLIFGDIFVLHNMLKDKLPPAHKYICIELLSGEMPLANNRITELFDKTLHTTTPPFRQSYEFTWGCGYFRDRLIIRVDIAVGSIVFSADGTGNTVIKIRLPSEHGTCLECYEISFLSLNGVITAKCNSDNVKCVVRILGEIISVYAHFTKPEGVAIRFKIHRESKLSVGDNLTQLYMVRVPKFEDIYQYSISCLNSDKLIFKQWNRPL